MFRSKANILMMVCTTVLYKSYEITQKLCPWFYCILNCNSMWYCSVKSTLAKQINNYIYLSSSFLLIAYICNLYTYRFSRCFQAIVCIIIMFSINWIYSFVEISVAAIIYVYIGQASPGYFPGQFTYIILYF